MKRFVITLAGLVLLAIASNAFGEIIKWDNDSGDNLWKTATNWDLNRVPSIASEDFTRIVLQEPNHCIIDASHTDANAAETKNLRVGVTTPNKPSGPGDLWMTGGFLTVSSDVRVGVKNFGRFYMDGGTVSIGEDLYTGRTLEIYNVPVPGTGILILTGGNIMVGGRWYIACGADSNGIVTISSANGPATIHASNKSLRIGDLAGATGTLNMQGGTINCDRGMGIGRMGASGTLNMQSGIINTWFLNIGKTPTDFPIPGTGVVTMTGGIINIADRGLNIGLDGSTGHLQLDGGTIWADDVNMGTAGSADPCGTMDIKAGTLIIDGDSTDLIAGYMNDPNGWITADDGTGNLFMDYDIRNPGKTTLTATSGDTNQPMLTINVEPNDIGIDSIVPPITEPIYYWRYHHISIGAGPSKLKCPYVYRFHHWEGDVADPNSSSTTVFMDEDKTVTAVFFEDERVCGDECHPILQGDLNQDCYINLEDFVLYANQWLSCTHPDCDEL